MHACNTTPTCILRIRFSFCKSVLMANPFCESILRICFYSESILRIRYYSESVFENRIIRIRNATLLATIHASMAGLAMQCYYLYSVGTTLRLLSP